MAQEIGAAVIGLVTWELKGLLLRWKPTTGAPVRNRYLLFFWSKNLPYQSFLFWDPPKQSEFGFNCWMFNWNRCSFCGECRHARLLPLNFLRFMIKWCQTKWFNTISYNTLKYDNLLFIIYGKKSYISPYSIDMNSHIEHQPYKYI